MGDGGSYKLFTKLQGGGGVQNSLKKDYVIYVHPLKIKQDFRVKHYIRDTLDKSFS